MDLHYNILINISALTTTKLSAVDLTSLSSNVVFASPMDYITKKKLVLTYIYNVQLSLNHKAQKMFLKKGVMLPRIVRTLSALKKAVNMFIVIA